MDDPWVEWSAKVNQQLADLETKHKVLVEVLPRVINKVCAEMISKRVNAGIWNSQKSYLEGSLVSHGGGGWIATADSRGVRPGEGNACWRLAIKSDTAHLKRVVADELNRRWMNGDGR
jgi:hypothetical protein